MIDFDLLSIIIVMSFSMLLLFSLIGWMIKQYFKTKRERENYDIPDEELQDDINAEEAKVVSRRGADEWSDSIKTPSYHLGLYVTFMRYDGSVLEFSVSEEIYKKCVPGTVGTLVTINDRFLDFGEGEEIQ